MGMVYVLLLNAVCFLSLGVVVVDEVGVWGALTFV